MLVPDVGAVRGLDRDARFGEINHNRIHWQPVPVKNPRVVREHSYRHPGVISRLEFDMDDRLLVSGNLRKKISATLVCREGF